MAKHSIHRMPVTKRFFYSEIDSRAFKTGETGRHNFLLKSFLTRTQISDQMPRELQSRFFNRVADPPVYSPAEQFHKLLTDHSHEALEDIKRHLQECRRVSFTDELILDVLQRHRSSWKPAFAFFEWIRESSGYSPGVRIYNEVLDTLGRMRRFEEVHQVLDEMLSREKLVNFCTYEVVVRRLASAHSVDEAIKFFDRIEDLGLEHNLCAFQTLLLALCRYKHVEEAESLFRNRKAAFTYDVKTWNIILSGWCLLRSLPDAKRFWKDLLASNCKPDKFSYGIFINCLSKKGKITTAAKLLKTMREKGCEPDTPICNTVIDGLCFKKRIPEALQLFDEMNTVYNCPSTVSTYNSLIKHMCKIRRMEEADRLIREMEGKGGDCKPTTLTYVFLLRSAKKSEEVDGVLDRMERSGCEVDGDCLNLLLRLFVSWGDGSRARKIWDEMERHGLGPDRRSYAIVIHDLCEKGMMKLARGYYGEMVSKGLAPDPRTKLLIDSLF